VYAVDPATITLWRMEELLSSPDHDKDAVNSLWDTVMELYGSEAVTQQVDLHCTF
jgi:hypothetical protein